MSDLPSPSSRNDLLKKAIADQPRLAVVLAGGVVGILLGWLATQLGAVLAGGFVAGVVGALWLLRWADGERVSLTLHRLSVPGLPDVEIAVDRSHREAAWRILVQLTSRVATQPVEDDEGEDELALRSLHTTFTSIREELVAMTPGHAVAGVAIESVALRLLNRELRPFLTRWHPVYDAWKAKATGEPWPEHTAFREDLRALQGRVRPYVDNLARMLGLDTQHLLLASEPPASESELHRGEAPER